MKTRYVLVILVPCEETKGLTGFMPVFETKEDAERYREELGYFNAMIEEFYFFEENLN